MSDIVEPEPIRINLNELIKVKLTDLTRKNRGVAK